MTRTTIQNWVRREPFEAFEVRMSNGQSIPVPHPEYAALGLTNLIFMRPESDEYAALALLHIASIEKLGSPEASPN